MKGLVEIFRALFLPGTRAVVYRNYITWKRFKYSSAAGNLGEPLLYLAAFGLGLGKLVGEIDGRDYLHFFAPAILAVGAMNSATFETTYSSYTRLTVQKTFDAIITTPVSVEEVIAAEILWGAIKSMISCAAIYVIFLAFGLIQTPGAFLAVPILMLLSFLFSATGMLATSAAKSYEFFTFYFYLFINPMMLFSGTFFPLEGMHPLMQKAAWLLPLTHGVGPIRALFYGETPVGLWGEILWLGVVAATVYALAIVRVRRRIVV